MAVAILKEVSIIVLVADGFPKLLQRPGCRRVSRHVHVHVHQTARPMLDLWLILVTAVAYWDPRQVFWTLARVPRPSKSAVDP